MTTSTPPPLLGFEERILTDLTAVVSERESTSASAPAPAGVAVFRRRPRRFFVGASVTGAATVAVTVAGVLTTPWSGGKPADTAAAAFSVARNPDGTVGLEVRWRDLRNTDALNALLKKAGVRGEALLPTASCTARVALDPKYSTINVSLLKHPELRDPKRLAAWLEAQRPWLRFGKVASDDTTVFTIRPDLIPAGDQLLIPLERKRTVAPDGALGTDAISVGGLIVPTLPSCVPTSDVSVITDTELRHR